MLNFSSFLRAGALASLLPAAALAQTPTKLVDVTDKSSGLSRFSTDVNGALLAGGEFDGDPGLSKIPQEGAGTRLMWYPSKAAFRAGYVNGRQWDVGNIGNYSVAMGYGTRAQGDYSTALGFQTWAFQTGSTAIGQYCAATGVASVALGYYANTNGRQGSFVFADRSVLDDGNDVLTDEAFRAPVNHAAYWRVTGGFRVATGGSSVNGGYDVTRGVSILPAATTGSTTDWGFSSTTASPLIATSSGAYLSNGGTWTNSSDRNRKHLFESVSGEDVLARLRQVPMQRWSYKTEPATVRHLGPMAQDFRKAFQLGPDSVSIGTVDADGVALAGVQALDARTRQQAAELAILKAENQALKARLDALDRREFPQAAGLPLWSVLLLGAAVCGGGLLLRRRAADTPA